MTTSTLNFNGYDFTVTSEATSGETRTFTVTLGDAVVVEDWADATSHAEVVEHLDTAPLVDAIAAAEAGDDDGGDYYRQVCSDYYTDRL